MRTHSPLRLVALVAAVTFAVACGGGEAQPADSAASAPTPPPAPTSYTLAAEDGSWNADITPQGIVYRRIRGSRTDSLIFDFSAPEVNGAISNYEILRTSPDTTRLTITLSRTPCKDKKGNEYTHLAQLWLTGAHEAQGSGCAKEK
ncbi:MAG TPA: hypothetical protein VF178_16700 [Gemmatimonadaceae bacterium]